MGMPMVLY